MDSGELVGREKHGAHRPQPGSQPGGVLCHRQSRGLEPWERAVRKASRESERDSEEADPRHSKASPVFTKIEMINSGSD